MVQIIAGKKGKGKTKYLLDMANNAIKESKGSIVYLDKSSKHMYEPVSYTHLDVYKRQGQPFLLQCAAGPLHHGHCQPGNGI